jgi:membrane protease YdiL (CAAX protease family)
MNTIKILGSALILLILCQLRLPAQSDPSALANPAAETNPVTATPIEDTIPTQAPLIFLTGSKEGDILLADLGAFGGAFSAIGLNFGIMGLLGADGEYTFGDQLVASAMTELSDIPLALSGSADALPLSIAGGLLYGAESLASPEWGLYGRPAQLLYWAKLDLAMYKAYDAYANVRLRSPAWDNSSFKRRSFGELAAGTLDSKNLADGRLWIAVGLGCATVVAPYLIEPSRFSSAVWNSNQWYYQDQKVGPAGFALMTGLDSAIGSTFTGIGEESVFRGFFHEELGNVCGKELGTVIDTGAFALMHLVTDISRGTMSWSDIAIHVSSVTAMNLLLDWMYDEGGLPLSVAAHAWTDLFAGIFNGILTGGAPINRQTK